MYRVPEVRKDETPGGNEFDTSLPIGETNNGKM